MMSYIDLILQETDYYKDSAITVSSNEFLLPTAQKTHRPPSGKKWHPSLIFLIISGIDVKRENEK